MTIRVTNGTGTVRDVTLEHPVALVGRHRKCDVRLPREPVSTRHALLLPFGDRVFLMDLCGSTGVMWPDGAHGSGWLASGRSARIGDDLLQSADGSQLQGSLPPDPTHAIIPGTPPPPAVELTFIAGSLQGTTYRLKRSVTLIGRAPSCKIRLRDDECISRIHACLVLSADGVVVCDTLSRHGIEVDGRRVRSAHLRQGQHLRIGPHVMRVTVGEETGASGVTPAADNARSACVDRVISCLKGLRNVHGAERQVRIQTLLDSGDITSWQARKIQMKDPARLIMDDRFLLQEPVGRGNMGTVYRAHDAKLDQTVAVKLPHREIREQTRRLARVRREVLISLELKHPQIVPLREFGSDMRFLVFEFISGLPMNRLIAERGPQDADAVVHWTAQIADALDYARTRGIIHRDVKPANVIVTDSGDAMLLDLGLACLSPNDGVWAGDDEVARAITRVGFTVGTAEFMSPEQSLDPRRVDSRSDIYSLGCTMYALLAGAPPFRARSPVELIRQHLEEPPPPIPGLSLSLSKILDKMLAKSQDQRFGDPGQLSRALRALRD